MQIDFENEIVEVDGKLIVNISTLSKVGKCNISLMSVSIDFIYADDNDVCLFYDDYSSYDSLIKLIAGNSEQVGKYLKKYKNDFGIEHEIWKQLLRVTIKKYGIDEYAYIDECGLDLTSDYVSFSYDKEYLYPRRVDSNSATYQLLTSVLPENYAKTKQSIMNKELDAQLSEYTIACGSHFENRSEYLQNLKSSFGAGTDKWIKFKNHMSELRDYIINDFPDNSAYQEAVGFMNECICFAEKTLEENLAMQLYKQYGPISELKNTLRSFINTLGFMELLDVFKDYKNKEKVVESKIRMAGVDPDCSDCKAYVDIFRLGSVLISDRMNHVNKNKAKHKYIPQELIDEALVFYYDTPSAQDAQTARMDDKYMKDKESGDKGEERVEYALKWLDKSFVQIEKRSTDKVGNSCIKLLSAGTEYCTEQK